MRRKVNLHPKRMVRATPEATTEKDNTGMNGCSANLGLYQGYADEVWEAIPELDNQTAVYNYRDSSGQISFQKVKLEWFDGVRGGERTGKSFLYRHMCDVRSGCDWVDWETGKVGLHLGKPARANGLLYKQPQVDFALEQGITLWIVEGEKDADLWQEVIDRGNRGEEGVVTTHHQGAEVGPSAMQVARIHGHTDIRILMDNDSAGAYVAWKWAEMLSWDGVWVYRPLDCWGDIGEALLATKGWEAGAGKELLVSVEPKWLRDKAMEHMRLRKEAWKARGKRRDYRPGQRISTSAERLGEAVSK